jgi:hypothetical protein
MSTDTGQPGLAPENVALADAANAFKVHLGQIPAPVARDEGGRFTSTAAQEEAEEIEAQDEAQALPEAEEDVEQQETEEAADEAQPDAVDMPASWSKEDAEAWAALPPEAQAKIAEREGQREAAVNQKFQEAANARKASEAQLAEANANREKYRDAIDQVLSLVTPQRPDPTQFGLGTGEYDRESYDLAVLQYEQAQSIVTSLQQQREEISAQQAREEEAARKAAQDEIERIAWPRFVADVAEMADPAKAPVKFREIVQYAVSQGIPEAVFTDPQVSKHLTSPELHMAWKAMMFDRQREAAKRMKDNKPAPKPAQPAVRPGVTTPRAAIEATKLKGSMDRLTREGSVEAGAAVFKHLFKDNRR